ncbi:MAG: hypothetical protein IPM84_19595 [Anaerolineae bacterium]|nr:hypothetical protein [Anaerolineae bacterium]
MQRVMLRMVAVEGSELARRRVALSELVYPTAEENERVKMVLDRLVGVRLLVRGTSDNPDGTKGEAYVEPAHDALVLAWDKLLRWKQEAEEYLPLQRRLAQAAKSGARPRPMPRPACCGTMIRGCRRWRRRCGRRAASSGGCADASAGRNKCWRRRSGRQRRRGGSTAWNWLLCSRAFGRARRFGGGWFRLRAWW